MANGQEIARDNLKKFMSWCAERRSADDWADYARHGKLNRTEIARECIFSPSVLRQNPAVKQQLLDIEGELVRKGVLKTQNDADEVDSTSNATHDRLARHVFQKDQSISNLEQKNA